jgi:putative oxidoreductase
MNQSILTNTALTVLRVIVGFIFAAHGFQKFNEFTIPGTQAAFAQMGVPAAEFMAPVLATLEVVGGIALIAGILARVFAALLVLDVLGALVFVHARAGIFVENGGFEFVLTLAAASLAIALTGAGRLSADAALFGGRNAKLSVLAQH